jgi:hypothetical protein
MKFGVKSGIGFLVIGLIFFAANYFTMKGHKYFPALLVMAPLCIGLGLGFMIFHGPEPGPEVPDKEKVKHYWRTAPMMSKMMWILLSVAGGAVGIYLMTLVDKRF